MTTGIVIFLCIICSILLIFVGYMAGVRYMTDKYTSAYINALFDCNVDRAVIERVVKRTKELLIKECGG